MQCFHLETSRQVTNAFYVQKYQLLKIKAKNIKQVFKSKLSRATDCFIHGTNRIKRKSASQHEHHIITNIFGFLLFSSVNSATFSLLKALLTYLALSHENAS